MHRPESGLSISWFRARSSPPSVIGSTAPTPRLRWRPVIFHTMRGVLRPYYAYNPTNPPPSGAAALSDVAARNCTNEPDLTPGCTNEPGIARICTNEPDQPGPRPTVAIDPPADRRSARFPRRTRHASPTAAPCNARLNRRPALPRSEAMTAATTQPATTTGRAADRLAGRDPGAGRAGRRGDLRLSGRRRAAALRRDLPAGPDPPHPGAARAGARCMPPRAMRARPARSASCWSPRARAPPTPSPASPTR